MPCQLVAKVLSRPPSNHRMKLTGRGRRFARLTDTQAAAGAALPR